MREVVGRQETERREQGQEAGGVAEPRACQESRGDDGQQEDGHPTDQAFHPPAAADAGHQHHAEEPAFDERARACTRRDSRSRLTRRERVPGQSPTVRDRSGRRRRHV